LHNETFWGLVAHFVGHYFHYDSKFWKTLKALWFSPGKLTTAYWKKQRMRYIPPVSLYIFISAVFFICLVLTNSNKEKLHSEFQAAKKEKTSISTEQKKADSLQDYAYHQLENIKTSGIDKTVQKTITPKIHKVREDLDDPDKAADFIEGLMHSFPKIFFFLIPLTAFLLKLLFYKRKELMFVHHAIFSLHVHSFCFSLLMLSFIPVIGDWISVAALLGVILYLILSMKNAYSIKWVKAISYSLILFIGYVFFGLIALIADVLILSLT